MRTLVVSDVVNQKLYNPNISKIVGELDLIISCGDLPVYYLDFIVSMLGKPLYYVLGNHDDFEYENPKEKILNFKEENTFQKNHLNYNKSNNFGGKNIDNKIVIYKDIIFAGLEGSYLYNNGAHQFNENQMKVKILKLVPGLILNKIIYGRYLDVLVVHAPPRGIHDAEDLPHRGFKSYITFIDLFKPKYILHGHTHIYDYNKTRITEYKGTKIINCYDYQIIDLNIF